MYEKSITMFNHTLQMRHQLEYYNLQAKLYEDSTKNLIQHRKLRHDYKNHLITIQGLLESKEFEQADAYISDLLITPGEVTKIIDNRNPTLSAILTYKNRECLEKGIAFQYRLDYDEIHIDPVDLTILIGNLLDNAIEACMKLEEGAEKKIRFSLTTEKSALAILCANPYHEAPKQKGKRFLTSKNDPLNHGLGLGNVEDVLSKYDGSKKVDPENGMFLISLILNNE
jgi:sensor histidine kinase regulating citrate/malate metabolism